MARRINRESAKGQWIYAFEEGLAETTVLNLTYIFKVPDQRRRTLAERVGAGQKGATFETFPDSLTLIDPRRLPRLRGPKPCGKDRPAWTTF
jgi:hypothetical protein